MKLLTESTEVYWLIVAQVNLERRDSFRATSRKLIASTQMEEGCLNYEWSLSDDGSILHIYERYVDSAAVKVHRERNGALVAELMQWVTPVSFTLFGSPTDEVKALLAGRNPILMQPLDGFKR